MGRTPVLTTDVALAAERLRAGGLVAIPTETVYGLAAAIDRPEAVRRVFEMKERPSFDPLIVHIADREDVGRVASAFPALARALAERFWPGPLTLVLLKRPEIDARITAGLETVGVRVPAREATRRLIRAVGAPLAAPSANKFARTSPTNPQHVAKEFAGEDLLILDDGPCDVGIESTVVQIDEPGERIVVLRPGGVSAEELSEAAARAGVRASVERAHSRAAPGHAAQHYMPGIPLVLIGAEAPPPDKATAERIRARLGAGSSKWTELALDADPRLAARTLYADMRRLAESGAGFIIVRAPSRQEQGLWDAILDRLVRAATLDLREMHLQDRAGADV